MAVAKDWCPMSPFASLSVRVPRGFLPLALLATLGGFRPASATTFAPPLRPLTETDRMSRSVGGADAICIGTLETVRDTIIPLASNPQFAKPYRTAWLRIAEVVHGPFRSGQLVRLGSWDGSFPEHTTHERTKDRVRAMFFLRRVDHGHDHDFPEPPMLPTFVDWQIDQNPYTVPGGSIEMTGDSEPAVRRAVRDALERQTLESMARKADLVVVATVGEPDFNTTPGQGSTARIDEVLAPSGSFRPGSKVRVSTVLGHGPEDGQYLLFLRRRPNESYEILEFDAGSDLLTRGVLKRRNLRLDEARDRVIAARRRK